MVADYDDTGFEFEGEIGEVKTGSRMRRVGRLDNFEVYDFTDWDKAVKKKRIAYQSIGAYGVMDSRPSF